MLETATMISTGEAASIVGVHESTVKRWCDAGDLAAQHTAGGHRRIPLTSLLEFTSLRRLETPLLDFGDDAEEVYGAATEVGTGRFDPAVELLYLRLRERRAGDASRFVRMLLQRGVSLETVLDDLLAPTLHRVGRAWSDGLLSVGDEHQISALMEEVLHDLRREVRKGDGRERALVACLEKNRHDMGAAMVRIVLEAAGWDVIYLGADVPIGDLAVKQQATGSRLVCVSLTEPQVASDAARLVHLLSGVYDPGTSYRLALGGAPLRGQLPSPLPAGPFVERAVFDSLKNFSAWL